MTKPTSKKSAQAPDRTKSVVIAHEPGKSDERKRSELGINPAANAMSLTHLFNKGTFGELSMTDTFEVMVEAVTKAEAGDLTGQRAMLASQAIALNSIFTEFARRSAANMGEYIEASERYMRMALKAQAQSRSAVEALDRLANGHEQTVRHVHVDNRGGQAVIADTVNTGGQENGKIDGQPHAIEGGGASFGQPLRSQNAERDGMSVTSHA
jgi:hypothetical protein